MVRKLYSKDSKHLLLSLYNIYHSLPDLNLMLNLQLHLNTFPEIQATIFFDVGQLNFLRHPYNGNTFAIRLRVGKPINENVDKAILECFNRNIFKNENKTRFVKHK